MPADPWAELPGDGAAGVSYLRIAGVVVAIALLAFLGWRVSLSFSQGAEIAEQQAHITSLEVAAARDSRVSQEMARFRGQQADFKDWWRGELEKRPITHEVGRYVDKTTGKELPCIQRDPPRYRSLFNQAVTGSADLP